MVQINFSLKEVNCKVVYYGPGLSGKTTNLEVVHQKAPSASTGDLTSKLATEGDRTLFFDFLPLNLGQVAGMKTKFQIYTVPGQVYYNSTRKLVLQGSDGVVFVADSKKGKMQENIEALNNLKENMKEYGLSFNTVPIVLQYNKRDLPEVYTIEEMDKALNPWGAPVYEAVARDGVGVFPTLKCLAGLVLESLNKPQSPKAPPPRRSSASPVVSKPNAVGPRPAVAPQHGGGATAVATPPAPARPAVSRPAVRNPAPAAAQAKPAPAVAAQDTSAPKSGGGKGKIVVGIVFLLVAGLAAYLYMSGLWEKLLP